MKKFIISILLLAGAAALAFFLIPRFFSEEEPAEPEEVPQEINFTLLETERLAVLPGELEAEKGEEFLVVRLSGINNDVDIRQYNQFYFTFADDEGEEYSNALNTRIDALSHGELAPGAVIRGSIVFVVPEDAKGELVITDELDQEILRIPIS